MVSQMGVNPMLERQLTKLIVPFAFKAVWNDRQLFEQNGWHSNTMRGERLVEYVDRLLDSEDETECIGSRYRFDATRRSLLGLPRNFSCRCSLPKARIDAPFAIEDIDLFVFESQIGFLVLSIGYMGEDVENLVAINYYLKRLNRADAVISFEEGSPTERINREFSLASLVSKLTAFLGVESFFVGRGESPSEALLFVGVLLKWPVEERGDRGRYSTELLFRLRKGYKSSYHMGPADSGSILLSEELELFTNSSWGISLEGAANVLWLVGKEPTDSFFRGPYFGNLNSTYLYLYLVALHQRYALLHLTSKAAELVQPRRQPAGNRIGQYSSRKLSALQELIAVVDLRSSFGTVSSNSIHHYFYEKLSLVLRLKDLRRELHGNVEMISTILSVLRREEDDKAARRSKWLELRVLILSMVFIVMTSTADIWEMANRIDEASYPHQPFLRVLLCGVLASVWGGVAYLGILYYRKNRAMPVNER